jgi:hypothetical protein
MTTLILLIALTFTWVDTSDNEEGFVIEKSIGNCNGFEPYSFHGAGIQKVVDTAVGVPGDCYRVGAFNDSGIAYSNTAQIAQPPPPPPCVIKGKSKKCH